MAAPLPAAAERQFLVFTLADTAFGLPVESIAEIVQPRPLTVLPKAPSFLRGIIQLRNQVVPVLDLRERFGFSTGPAGRYVIVRRPSLIAYWVDRVDEVIRCPASDLLPPPPAAALLVASDFLDGVISQKDRFVLVLKPEMLLTPVEQRLLGGAIASGAPAAGATE
jgi:purine-binding chemotaxis protein CheW